MRETPRHYLEATPMTAADGNYADLGRHAGHGMPFGYRLERDANMLVLRRPDGSLVTVFDAWCADRFEVEAAVWEDAD